MTFRFMKNLNALLKSFFCKYFLMLCFASAAFMLPICIIQTLSQMPKSNVNIWEGIDYKVRDDSNFVSKHVNMSIANDLLKEVRIFCLINTVSSNYYKRVVPIKYTWGKRCQRLAFVGLPDHFDYDAINISNEDSKFKYAFQYIYRHHVNDAEWFLLTDDLTYFVMENLRFLLYPYDPQIATYFFIQPFHLGEVN
uniref:Hexosyltransferase n=1 Tax=Glossina brevipalpis TaxID=37001 RepID=A0A1A9VZA2_9MUSC